MIVSSDTTLLHSSPIIITLDSEGSQDGLHAGAPELRQQEVRQQEVRQQALGWSDLLPLLLPEDVCQTTGGQLPVGTLNQGLHGSDQGPPPHTQDGSDHDVDIETVEGPGFLLGWEEVQRSEVFSSSQQGQSEAASLLGDPQAATQPKWSLTPTTHSHSKEGGSLPELPPLLRQVSPIRSYSRNTPPPLRRSDAPTDCAAPAAAGCSTNHKPGPAPQSSSFSLQQAASASPADVPPAQSRSTSTERRKERSSAAEDTPPAADGRSGLNHSHKLLEDFVPSGERGVDSPPSPVEGDAPARLCPPASSMLSASTNSGSFSSDVSCRSSQTGSSAAAGAAMDTEALSLGHEDEPRAHLQSSSWKCAASGSALSSSAPSEAGACSHLLADPQESQPPVGSH